VRGNTLDKYYIFRRNKTMKRIITLVVMTVMLFTAAFAAAEVTVSWDVEVTGIEVTDMEKEFVEDGWDLAIVVIHENPDSEVKMEKDLLRWTNDEDFNYNEAYTCLYDEYGLRVGSLEGAGSLDKSVAVCRTHDTACVVKQLVDYLEKNYPGKGFEMYVFENK
jgi:opacity protein-like surface antigen